MKFFKNKEMKFFNNKEIKLLRAIKDNDDNKFNLLL
jgi:hypothetical protein